MRLPRFCALLLSFLLGACSSLSTQAPPAAKTASEEMPAAQAEIEALLAQPFIDPLAKYLERRGTSRDEGAERVRAERDRRCTAVAQLYAERDKTTANRDKLERGYRYACPEVVDAFARQIADKAATSAEAAAPTTPAEHSVPAAVRTPALGESEEAHNCYLLFAIRNYGDARAACRAPAERGDARAQYDLAASAHALELHAEVLTWARRAAAQQLPVAQHLLGLIYYRGEGVPQDRAHALRWFEQAAGQGLAEAQYMAALMYQDGEGAKRDGVQALNWLSRAARQGHGEAQFALGERYARGEGVTADPAAATRWFRAAAEQGVTEAQLRLGERYASGTGVAPDPVRAYIWLSMAAAGGNRSALAARERAAEKLTAAQLADAREQARRALEQRR